LAYLSGLLRLDTARTMANIGRQTGVEPLDDLHGYLARHKLRVVGGTTSPDGRRFRPILYLADAENAS